MIQVCLLLHAALAGSLLAASYGRGSIPYLRNLTYRGVRGSFWHLKKKKKRRLKIGLNKYDSHCLVCLVWENKAQGKQFKSQQYGTEHFSHKELFVFCNSVNVTGEKKGSIKWSLSKGSLSCIMRLKRKLV